MNDQTSEHAQKITQIYTDAIKMHIDFDCSLGASIGALILLYLKHPQIYERVNKFTLGEIAAHNRLN